MAGWSCRCWRWCSGLSRARSGEPRIDPRMKDSVPESHSVLNATLGFFYPQVCQLCSRHPAAPAEGFVCAPCWQRVRFITPPFCDRCGLPFEGDLTTKFECANCREME